MNDKLKGVLITITVIAALAAGGAAISGAAGGEGAGDDDARSERPITGQALDRASAVALEEVGGGKVTQTEAGDEEGAYEVEVTKSDGSQVDVHLDKGFNVLDSSADREDGGSGEDGTHDD